MASVTLTQQLNRIGQDILKHLAESTVALTQTELFERSELRFTISSYGWSFALEKLEIKHEIEFIEPYHWQLKNPDRGAYLRMLSEISNTKVRPD